MKNQKMAYQYVILVVLFWATVASAFKLTLVQVDSITMLFYSSLTSSIVLFVVMVFQGKIRLLREYSTRDYLKSFLLGALNPFVYYLILFKAYSLLPAQEAQPLNQTWAILVPLLSFVIFKHRISLKSILALAISFIGVLVLVTRGNPFSLNLSNPFGVSLALSSAIIWALYWIYNMHDERDEVSKLFLNFLFGTILVAIVFLTQGADFPSLWGLIGSVYIGTFEMGITFVLWLKAMNLSETTAKVTNLIYLVPFISLFVINVTIGEPILWSTILGLLLIVGGITVQQKR